MTRARRTLDLLTLACATSLLPLILSGCPEDSSLSPVDAPRCADEGDCPGDDVCVEGQCAPPQEPADAGLDADNAPDGALEDVAPDVPPEEVGPELGGFGVPCDSNDDCIARVCIDTASLGRICSDFCLEDAHCEEGFSCRVYQNEEAISICLEDANFLCDPCDEDLDCGGASDLCVRVLDGDFCGRDCSRDSRCPEGFECLDITDENEALIGQQCVPVDRLCSDCLDNDRDGYGIGEACLGMDCDDGDDDRSPGAPEVCDEIDNDCDDQIDEDFDLDNDPDNCGACGRLCALNNAATVCQEALCAIEMCNEGFRDLNGDPLDGCEYACVFVSDEDEPDPMNRDTNCDGIDGDINDAIFVQQDIGDDQNPGTPQAPMRTIPAAIQRALEQGKDVYVGTSRDPYPGPISLVNGVDLHGGFDFDAGLRRDTSAITRIDGPTVGVQALNITRPTTLAGFEIRTGAALTPGASSYGVWISNSSSALSIRNNTIIAGRGADGIAGSSGDGGREGAGASGGAAACETYRCLFNIEPCRPGGGGGAGTNNTCASGLPGGAGGAGGDKIYQE